MDDESDPADAVEPRRPSVAAAIRAWRDELHASAIFLTRLPVRWRGDMPADLPARSLRAGPLVGAAIGLAAGLVYAGSGWLGLPATLAAVVAVGAQVAVTGALHEDGLADVADGFGGGDDREAKLAIMRDSRIGAYGAVALMLTLAARILAIAALAQPVAVMAALAAAGAASRAAWPGLMVWLRPARAEGLAASHGRPALDRLVATVGLAALVALIALPLVQALVALAVGAAAATGLGLLAQRQIDGYTGDVLGAAQQSVEVAMLLALAALA